MFSRTPKNANVATGGGPNLNKALPVARFDMRAWMARRAAAGRPVTTNLPDRGAGHRAALTRRNK